MIMRGVSVLESIQLVCFMICIFFEIFEPLPENVSKCFNMMCKWEKEEEN